MNDKPKYISDWIRFFGQHMPELTKDEADLIEDVCTWEGEKKAGFLFAKRLFEEKDEEEND